jgi:DNA-binding MarR family transcriptional regulator
VDAVREEQLGSLIDRYERATLVVTRRMAALLRDTIAGDLTLDQYNIIRHINRRRMCTATELSEIYCVGKSAITAIADRLAEKGLIRRTPDRNDRRVIFLSLTQKGEQLCETLSGRIQQVLSRYLSHFTTEEVSTFIGTFEKLARLLEKAEETEDDPVCKETDEGVERGRKRTTLGKQGREKP